jgi:hypothetical protein
MSTKSLGEMKGRARAESPLESLDAPVELVLSSTRVAVTECNDDNNEESAST